MLPSVEAFLALWNNPCEFVELHVAAHAGYFLASVVVEPPNIPKLTIDMHPIKTGVA